MSEFLRPEASATLWKWRGVIIGLAVLLLGVWWGLNSFGVLKWLGWVIALLGAALAFTGFQRMRFARGGGGAGIVDVDERRISYLGPLTGGVIDLDLLTELQLDPTARPAHWRLTATGSDPLFIPVDAEGADALFDMFAALPGIQTERMLEALNTAPKTKVVIWKAKSPDHRLLH